MWRQIFFNLLFHIITNSVCQVFLRNLKLASMSCHGEAWKVLEWRHDSAPLWSIFIILSYLPLDGNVTNILDMSLKIK